MSARETVLVSEVIPTSRDRIYSAWLDSRQHSAFTGEAAEIDPNVGGHISTFGGYASGKNIELEPARRIVQTWRSTEFPEGSPDSRLEVTLEDTAGGTLVTVLHTEIPEGQGDRYRESWVRYYLEPMKRYFAKHSSNGVNHPEAMMIEDVSAELLERGGSDEADERTEEDDELTDTVARISPGETIGAGASLDDSFDGVRGSSYGESGVEIIEEATLPLAPPPAPRAKSGRTRPPAQARDSAGKADRKKRVAAALARAGLKPGAGKAASKPSNAKPSKASKPSKPSKPSKAKPSKAKTAAAGKGAARAKSKPLKAGKTAAPAKGRGGKPAARKAAGKAAKAGVARAKSKAPAKAGKAKAGGKRSSTGRRR